MKEFLEYSIFNRKYSIIGNNENIPSNFLPQNAQNNL